MKRKNAPAQSVLEVLFIGNSFSARNDMPGIVARLAAADGRRLDHRLISAGAASLRRHWNKGDAVRAIREGGFDRVVLQEQSTLPIKGPQRMAESVRLLDAEIKAAGARTVLYMTWARRHAPETQAAITEAYEGLGRELGAAVIPAGVAWQEVLRLHPQIALYDRDGSHPTSPERASRPAPRSQCCLGTLLSAMRQRSRGWRRLTPTSCNGRRTRLPSRRRASGNAARSRLHLVPSKGEGRRRGRPSG